MRHAHVRLATEADIDAAFEVWLVANIARRGGRPPIASAHPRVRAHLERASSFPMVIEDDGRIVAMSCGMQAIDIDGDKQPVAGLCHIALVFVVPERWGEGLGTRIVSATLEEARRRGFDRAQLWTHADNELAQRLYARLGFVASGRRKPDDDEGEEIIHLERPL